MTAPKAQCDAAAPDHLVPWTMESGPVRLIALPPPERPPEWWNPEHPWVGQWTWQVAFLMHQGAAATMDEAIDKAGAAAMRWLEDSARAYENEVEGRRPRIEWYENRANVATMLNGPARRPMVTNEGAAGWTWALQGLDGWEKRDRLLATEGLAREAAVAEALEVVGKDIKHLTAMLMRIEMAKDVGGNLYSQWRQV